MEVIYDALKIPVPISPIVSMKVSPTPPVLKVPAPQNLLNTTNSTSTKIGQMGKYQGEEKSQTIMSRFQKEGVLSKIFMRKLAQVGWVCYNGISHTHSCGLTISVTIVTRYATERRKGRSIPLPFCV